MKPKINYIKLFCKLFSLFQNLKIIYVLLQYRLVEKGFTFFNKPTLFIILDNTNISASKHLDVLMFHRQSAAKSHHLP